MKKIVTLIFILIFLGTINGCAKPTKIQSNWITSTDSKCKVWNPTPLSTESITWSGICNPSGFAEGKGMLQWYKDGIKGGNYIGEYKNGKLHGKGTYTWTHGDQYIGEWKNEKIHGKGTYIWSNGDKYSIFNHYLN